MKHFISRKFIIISIAYIVFTLLLIAKLIGETTYCILAGLCLGLYLIIQGAADFHDIEFKIGPAGAEIKAEGKDDENK
jgi:hypothetical protein